MTALVLNNVTNLQDTTTAEQTINNNSSAIVTAVTSSVAKSGDQMSGSLDMNSNQILNLPAPSTANSPLRLQDLSTFNGDGTVSNIPAGGTTGQILVKSSNSDYAIEWTNTSASLTAGTNLSISTGTISTIANPNFGTSVTTPSLVLNGTTLTSVTGSDNIVLSTSPTIAGLTVTGSLTAIGLVTNAALAGSIAASKLIGSDIATVGTITAGTWNGSNITNTYLAAAGAATLKGNPTSSTTGVTDFTIQGLTNLSSPDASNDKLLVYNHTTGTLQYSTVGQVAAAATSGVSTLNGLTGGVTITGSSISHSEAGTTITLSLNTSNANTWAAIQTFPQSDLVLKGSSTGVTTLNSGLSSSSNNTLTLPTTASDTLAALGTAQTWTAAQTFTNSDLKLLGSSTGVTTFTSGNASSSNYTVTIPAATCTLLSSGGAVLSGSIAAPTGTTSNTPAMMGLGLSGFVLTPKYSSRVLVVLSGSVTNATTGDGAVIKLYTGTGTAPSNGAGVTGTAISGNIAYNPTAAGSDYVPFCITGIATGLTPGTATWYDVSLSAITGGAGHTASILDLTCSVTEI